MAGRNVDCIRCRRSPTPGNADNIFANRDRRTRRADINAKHRSFDRSDEIGRSHLEMSYVLFFNAEQHASKCLEYGRAQSCRLDLAQLRLTVRRKLHHADATRCRHAAVGAGSYFR